MHIPPEKILPQDMVDVFDLEAGAFMRMHITDAKHAMDVEPDRYSLDRPKPDLKLVEPEAEVEVEEEAEEEITGAVVDDPAPKDEA